MQCIKYPISADDDVSLKVLTLLYDRAFFYPTVRNIDSNKINLCKAGSL